MSMWLEPLIKWIGLVREPQVTSKKTCISPSTFSEKAMETHSSTLAWEIPWPEEPGGLQSMGTESRAQLSNFTFTFHFHALEKEMATHCRILVWRIPETEGPSGLPSMGSHRVGHDWSDLAAGTAPQLLSNNFYFTAEKECNASSLA